MQGDILLLCGSRVYEQDNNIGRMAETAPSEASVMLSYALNAGLQRNWIEVLDGSINTMETTITTKQRLSVWGIERLTVLTSDFTLVRAKTMCVAGLTSIIILQRPLRVLCVGI